MAIPGDLRRNREAVLNDTFTTNRRAFHALHVHNRKTKHPVCCVKPLDAISMDEALKCRRKDSSVMQVETTTR